jgi:hypothetical protein
MADLNSVQSFANPNFSVEPVVRRNQQQSGTTPLNMLELANTARSLTTLQKEQALLQPSIEQGIAQSKRAQTEAAQTDFNLQKSYQTWSQGLVNGLINDPDVNNGNKEGILKKLDAIEQFSNSVGLPKHPSDAINQMRKLTETDPMGVKQMLANRIVGGMEAGGQAQQALVPTSGQAQVSGSDISGNPTQIIKNQFGQIVQAPLPVGAAPGQGTVSPMGNMRINPGETVGTVNEMQVERNAAKQAASAAQPALTNIDTVLKYLPLAQTGKYSEAIAGMQSVLGNLAGDTAEEKAASARDIIQKNIADLGLQKNAALGGQYVKSLEAAQESLASAGKNPTAIAKSMQQLRPMIQHSLNYQQGLEKTIAKYGIQAKRTFDNEMIDAFDPQAMMVYNAYQAGDKKGFEELTKSMSETKKKEIAAKMTRYNHLKNGELQ